ncbi:MAG: hypothetical protein AAB540_04670 [Patescibacteria group bacterium]
MEVEQKRSLALGIIIAVVIIFAVIYFFWGTLINKGTIQIIADPPFTVEVFGDENFTCENSPCEIRQKTGLKDLILSKEGYKIIITEADVGLWRTTLLDIDFELIPKIAKTDSAPENENEVKYNLVMDDGGGMQKLVKENSGSGIAIVYFQKPLVDAKIFGSKNKALILSKAGSVADVYEIDIREKTRNKISDENLKNVTDGTWSYDGKYFVFEKENSNHLWLFNSGSKAAKQLAVSSGVKKTSWVYNGGLVFVTDQGYKSESESGKYGENYIRLMDVKSVTTFIVGVYHPDEDSYTRVELTDKISKMPDELIATGNGQNIYFKSGEEIFQIILRKF